MLLSLLFSSLPNAREPRAEVSSNPSATLAEQDSLGNLAQSIAGDYLRNVDLGARSTDLSRWILETGYQGVIDTFREASWMRWESEKYCFRIRITKNECTTEYSFFDNGDYSHPKAILQQILVFDRRTKLNPRLDEMVWDKISDSLTKRFGAFSDVPHDDMLHPFDLGAIRRFRKSRLWQDTVKRIVLAEHFRWEGEVRTDYIMLLSRERDLDAMLHRSAGVEQYYSTSFAARGGTLDVDLCDSLVLTKSPFSQFCPPDTSRKARFEDLIRCGEFISEAERAGDSAHLPLYQFALYLLGQMYSPQGNGDGPGPWKDVDTLKHYNIVFEWSHLGGAWEYSIKPLVDICTKFPNTRWGKMAFLILQNSGWCLDGMCNGNNGPEVISKGEEFLKRFPEDEYTSAVLLTIAKGYETNWNVSTCEIESNYIYDPNYRSDESSRLRAIATYERLLTEYPQSREATIAKIRLPRLKLGISTDRTDYFFIYD
jgi:hypothetical protein